MIWFFERGKEVVRVETSVDNSTQEYVLVIRWSDRAPETERFQAVEAFDIRVKELEEKLAQENFAEVGGPIILADGWRGPVSH